jgi:predicted Na+-dependent transporter
MLLARAPAGCGEYVLDRVADVVYNVTLVVALWATGLSLGISSRVADFLAPLRKVALLTKVIALDVVVIPLLVWVLTRLLAVPTDSATGVLLVGVASAGPLGITASRIAHGDARAAFAFVVVLEAINALAIPVWVVVLLPAGAHVSLGPLIVTLVLLVLAPLAVGIAIHARLGVRIERWAAPLGTVSSALVVLLVAAVLVRYSAEVGDAIAHGVVAVAALTVLAALALGWMLGGPGPGTRIAVCMVTGVRANGLALAIARASFPLQPDVHAAVVTFGLLSIVVPLAAAFVLAGRKAGLST